MKRYFLAVLTVFFIQCTSKYPSEPNIPPEMDDAFYGNPALVVVIENNEMYDPVVEVGFHLFHSTVLELFAEVFGVSAADMKDLTLAEIIDVYGEDWQINEIKKIAEPFCNEIVVLSDSLATWTNFLNVLTALHDAKHDIDIIFNLHGSSSAVLFDDKSWKIDELVKSIKRKNIRIRSLYQTCCYGSGMIDDWEKVKILCVNGAVGGNSLSLFSPAFFLSAWLSGETFENAVQTAYNMEIEKLKSYREHAPVMQYMLTDEMKEESRQVVGGRDKILRREYFLYRVSFVASIPDMSELF